MPALAYNETFHNEAIVKMLRNPNIIPEIISHRVPTCCQGTVAFVVNLDVLCEQSDITAGNNNVCFNGFGFSIQ